MQGPTSKNAQNELLKSMLVTVLALSTFGVTFYVISRQNNSTYEFKIPESKPETHSLPSKEVSSQLPNTGSDSIHPLQSHREAIAEEYLRDPSRNIHLLIGEYQSDPQNRPYWAKALAFAYLDDLEDMSNAVEWMEKSLILDPDDKNLTESLVELYKKSGQLERVADIVPQITNEATKNLLTSKILFAVNESDQAVTILKSLSEDQLDDASLANLKRWDERTPVVLKSPF